MDLSSRRDQPQTDNTLFLQSGMATLPKECAVNVGTIYTVPYWSLRYWGSGWNLITSPKLLMSSFHKMMDYIDHLSRKRSEMEGSWREGPGATEELSHTPSNAPIPSDTTTPSSPSNTPSYTPRTSRWTNEDVERSIVRVWYRSGRELLPQERRWRDGNHRFDAMSDDLSKGSTPNVDDGGGSDSDVSRLWDSDTDDDLPLLVPMSC